MIIGTSVDARAQETLVSPHRVPFSHGEHRWRRGAARAALPRRASMALWRCSACVVELWLQESSVVNHGSVKTSGEERLRHDENVPLNMTAIKGSGTPGVPRQFNVLSHVKYEYFVAGISGGVISTLVLHPLDLIKIRFAVNDGQASTAPRYSGLRNAIAQIVKTEGVRGLYRGVTPNILGSGSSWGFYFFFYNTIKTSIQGGNSKKPLGPSMHMFAAADAGVLTLLMTNPIWVVKTRLCLQYADDVNLAESKKYRGMIDALKKIYKMEGIRGLYKGLVPGLFGVSHGAIQFMAYEEMKNEYYNYLNVPIDTKLSTSEYIAFAAMSKLIAAASTYPYQVVRARLQDHHHDYRGTWHCIQCTWRYEGWRGFYKGLSVNLTRVTPATVITFVVYENMFHYLQSKRTAVEETIAVPAVSKLKE